MKIQDYDKYLRIYTYFPQSVPACYQGADYDADGHYKTTRWTT